MGILLGRVGRVQDEMRRLGWIGRTGRSWDGRFEVLFRTCGSRHGSLRTGDRDAQEAQNVEKERSSALEINAERDLHGGKGILCSLPSLHCGQRVMSSPVMMVSHCSGVLGSGFSISGKYPSASMACRRSRFLLRLALSSSGSLGRHFPAFKVICKTTTAGSPLQVARFLHLLPDIDAADPVFVFPCGLATKAGLLPAGCAGTFLVFPGWCPETANTNSARRQPALPSSRVTPSNACPTHRTTVVSSRPACAAMRHTSYSQR